ncbi:hypothetical protein Tco_1417424 [Tanacetum coccineum]
MRRCVVGDEIREILAHCHSGPTGGHHSTSITGRKVYEAGFFWPSIFKDAKDYSTMLRGLVAKGIASIATPLYQNNSVPALFELLSYAISASAFLELSSTNSVL